MTETWSHLLAGVAAPQAVVMLGGADATALAALLATGAGKLMVIEPDPVQAARLRKATGEEPRVTVLELAVSAKPGPQSLYRRSLSQFSGLRPATGLAALFPGLREIACVPVEAVDLTEAFERIGPPDEGILLVLGPTGEEAGLVEALLSGAYLNAVHDVIVTLPKRQLYDGAADGAALAERLEACGYLPAARDNTDDDLPVVRFHRDLMRLRVDELEALCDQLRTERDTMADELKTARTKLEALTDERDSLRAECDSLRERTPHYAVTPHHEALLDEETRRLSTQLDILNTLNEVRLTE